MVDAGATEPPVEPDRKPFAMVLQEMRKGGLHTELGDELADLVKTCMSTMKNGSITLTLKVAPMDDGSTCAIHDTIGVKAPRPDAPASLFWPDSEGNLSRQNPNQMVISALREIKGAKTESASTLKETGTS